MKPSRDTLRSLFPATAVFLLTASFIITKTARDALYIRETGLRDVALGFIFIAILSVPQARMVLLSSSRFGRRPTRVGIQLLSGTALALYIPFATAGTGGATTFFSSPFPWYSP